MIDEAPSVAGSSYRQDFGLKTVARKMTVMPKKSSVVCMKSKELRAYNLGWGSLNGAWGCKSDGKMNRDDLRIS